MKKYEKFIYLIIGLILLTVIVSSIVFGVKKKSNPDEKENPPVQQEHENVSLKESELEEYLSYVPIILNNEDSKKRTIENMDRSLLLKHAFSKISVTDSSYFETVKRTSETTDQLWGEPNTESEYYYMKEEKLNSLLKKMYNQSVEDYNFDQMTPVFGEAIVLSGSYCMYYYDHGFVPSLCGGTGITYHEVPIVEQYTLSDDQKELTIYAYLIGYGFGGKEFIWNPYTQEQIELTKHYEKMEDVKKEAISYGKENKDELTQYKHVFKKNETGYYWYSTEVVK